MSVAKKPDNSGDTVNVAAAVPQVSGNIEKTRRFIPAPCFGAAAVGAVGLQLHRRKW
jgi:hypothetical protein